MDFLLSSNGDIMFQEIDLGKRRLKINFFNSKTNVLKVDFEIMSNENRTIGKNGLIINFDYESMQGNKKIILADNINLLKQKLIIDIKTSLGELRYRKDVGSLMETVMHETITDSKTLKTVERIITDIVNKQDPSLSVSVEPYKNTDNEYIQALIVNISKNNNNILNYELEW